MKLKAIAMQKTEILMFYSFLQFKYVRAAMHRITSSEILGTLIAGVIAKQAN